MSDFSEYIAKSRAPLGKQICEALVKRGFAGARYADTAEDAARLALDMPNSGESVGIPGTVTVRQLGLIEKYEEKGCKVYQHWTKGISAEEAVKARLDENSADWFVTSSNAITYDGKLVNIDGMGNRVAAMAWGTGKILYIISVGKACRDVESALQRIRDRAVAPNAIRLGHDIPCTKTGICVDCSAPKRSCRVITIQEYAPMGRECHAIIVGEDLGY